MPVAPLWGQATFCSCRPTLCNNHLFLCSCLSFICFIHRFSHVPPENHQLNFNSAQFSQKNLWKKVNGKWKWESLSQVRLFSTPMDYTVHGILQARILEWVAVPFPRRSSQPRDWTQVSRIAGGFFISWAQGKPKNTGMGSLFFLQQIFPTQGSNQGLLHCRGILYQLSY